MSEMTDHADATDVRITVERELPRDELERIRERIATLARYTKSPPQNLRLTLRVAGANRAARKHYVADASMLVDGRLLAAHATGVTALAATEEVAERLRRQLRRIVGTEVARRDQPDELRRAASEVQFEVRHRPVARLRPPEEREIVAFLKVSSEPESTLGAVAELFERDLEFSLFRHARTSEDVVVHRREDERVGLLHPPGSALATERVDDFIIPEPSRYPEPISLADARSEMDVLNHRFLYFIAAEDQHGKVLYLRHDGNYGLVELDDSVLPLDPP